MALHFIVDLDVEDGGRKADVIGPPTDAEGGLFSEINDNSVAILLTYGTARILCWRRQGQGGVHASGACTRP